MGEIHISGLVRLMRWARDQLAAGVPPERADFFQRTVSQSLQQVERALGEARSNPARLPRPSLAAYRYLKEIDLQHLPVSHRKNAPIGLCQAILEHMSASLPALSGADRSRVIDELHQEVLSAHKDVSKRLKAGHGEPTRRAAAWLELLSDLQMLTRHLEAMVQIHRLAAEVSRPGNSFRVDFVHMASLYRVNARMGEVQLVAHEAFIDAPDEVLQALAGLAVSRRTRRRIQLVRTFAASPAFLQLSHRLASLEPGTGIQKTGKHYYQLEEAFERVNRAYFSGEIARPRLIWSRGKTYREFGHYQPASDTVSISQSLDSAQVPEYVLDYVVFHELLHKQLGVKTSSGRLYSHTPAFHQAEKRFPRCSEAKVYLQELSTQISHGMCQASRRRFRA